MSSEFTLQLRFRSYLSPKDNMSSHQSFGMRPWKQARNSQTGASVLFDQGRVIVVNLPAIHSRGRQIDGHQRRVGLNVHNLFARVTEGNEYNRPSNFR